MYSRIEESNFAHDPRTLAVPAEIPKLDGKPLPHRWEVCSLCDGEGSHVDPSIDAGGISAQDFAEDPDFADAYMSGSYDVPCRQCGGRTTIPVPDVGRCTFAQKRVLVELRREQQWMREDRLQQAREIAMGC